MTGSRSAATARRLLPPMALAGVVGLALGYVALRIVNAGIRFIWEHVPATWERTPSWYVLGVLVTAAVLVYLIRRFIGDTAHSPLGGITISPLTPREYLGAIAAIVASLWGGVVLGPEVALVATGSLVGGLVARAFGLQNATESNKVVGFGALGAILALFVGPIVSGSATLGQTPTEIDVDQLAWAIVVAVLATLAVTLARLVAALMARITGNRPHLLILLTSAVVIAVSALAMHYWTGEPVIFITTSGEELISELPQLTSVTTVLAIIILKSIAYAVSLGSGFRGGPFFPAMFIGAASGLLIALLLPDGPSVSAAIVVGVVAAVIATAPMKWPVAIGLGVVLGFLFGTWTLVPAAVIGAVIARAIPRLSDRVAKSSA